MKTKNNHLKFFKEEYEKKLEDYRQKDKEEMEKSIIKKLGELPIHRF